LKYIHSNGIIHKDIKPENLIFDKQGMLKIADFGISWPWWVENSTETSGTACYMAPEILAGKNHAFEIDFYSLGVLMYECIMG